VVNDHDIVLVNSTGAIVDIGATDNIMTGEGMEFVQFYNDSALGFGTAFHIVITFDSDNSPGPSAGLIKTVFFGEDGFSINEYQTDSSTLYGHANAAGAVSVGAASFLDTPEWGSPPILEPFSSAGGTPILIDTLGARLVVPEVRLKPEIIAVDGVNTTFFFEDLIGDMELDFFGTSAAAAHAAGVAALMLEAKPAATPEEIRTVLESTAIDMGVAGFDHDSGYGLIQADLALAALVLDTDADGVPDSVDNCINVPNGPFIPDSGGHGLPQWDTDGDGYGNLCDPDFNQNNFVDPVDFSVLKQRFGQPGWPDQDLNGNGIVDPSDFSRLKTMFGGPPGPSALAP
jgi:subtilisin family serine protease